MPHSTKTNGVTNGNPKANDSTPLTNGDGPHSQFVSRLISYPVVHDGITTVQVRVNKHPYGAKGVNFFTSIYKTLFTNVYEPVSPYFATPYSYVKPYLAKADSFGDSGLSKLEAQFPIVKEETPALKKKITETAQYFVSLPKAKATEAKEYVWKTYEDESNKAAEKGYYGKVKAVISTELRIIAEVSTVTANWLQTNTDKLKSKTNKKMEEVKSS